MTRIDHGRRRILGKLRGLPPLAALPVVASAFARPGPMLFIQGLAVVPAKAGIQCLAPTAAGPPPPRGRRNRPGDQYCGQDRKFLREPMAEARAALRSKG